jgi:hypothetical protein
VAISFDGATKLATLSTGTVSLSVADLWSRWVDWLAIGDNSKWLPAAVQVGGNAIDVSAGTSIPAYIYLVNGWRVKPQEANHTLSVTAGVLLVEGGGDPFVNTSGNFVVRVSYSQPVQAITVSTGGGSAPSSETIAAAVRAELGAELLRIVELAKIHGLVSGSNLVVTETTRTAGSISQTIAEVGATTTVSRV